MTPGTDDIHLDLLEPATVLRTWLTAPAQRMTDAVRGALETLLLATDQASMSCAGPPEVALLGSWAQVEVRLPVTGVPTEAVLSCFARRPGGMVARTFHESGLDGLAPTCDAVLTWIIANGYHAAGQPALIHLCGPERDFGLAELVVPVHTTLWEDCDAVRSARQATRTDLRAAHARDHFHRPDR
jgi:hypothetical protein